MTLRQRVKELEDKFAYPYLRQSPWTDEKFTKINEIEKLLTMLFALSDTLNLEWKDGGRWEKKKGK